MRPKSPTLTANELEMMKIVWQHDAPVTVRDVYEALRARRTIAYTTVMTSMKTLEQKGYLKATQQERAYLYEPAKPRQQVIKAMVSESVDRVFNGAAPPLDDPPHRGRPTVGVRPPRDRPDDGETQMTASIVAARRPLVFLQLTLIIGTAWRWRLHSASASRNDARLSADAAHRRAWLLPLCQPWLEVRNAGRRNALLAARPGGFGKGTGGSTTVVRRRRGHSRLLVLVALATGIAMRLLWLALASGRSLDFGVPPAAIRAAARRVQPGGRTDRRPRRSVRLRSHRRASHVRVDDPS